MLATALLLASCGCGSATSGASPAGPPRSGEVVVSPPHAAGPLRDRLVGHAFASGSYVKDGHSVRAIRGTRLRIAFTHDPGTGDTVSATGGCNRSSGRFRIVAGRLVVRGLSSTLIGCLDARPRQDAVVEAVLGHRPSIRIEGATLVLIGDGITIRARRTH